MSAALSLLDEDPFEEPRLTVVPASGTATGTAAPQGSSPVGPTSTHRSAWSAAAVVPALVLATFVASPALVQCLVHHQITASTMFERWGLVALVCCAIGEGVRRYVLRVEAARVAPEPAPDAPSPLDHLDPLDGLPEGL